MPGASPGLKKAVRAMGDELNRIFTLKRIAGHSHADDVRRANELIDAVGK